MTEILSTPQQKKMLHELVELVDNRFTSENKIESESKKRSEQLEQQHRAEVAEQQREYQQQLKSLEQQYEQVQKDAIDHADQAYEQAEKDFSEALSEANSSYETALKQCESKYREERWEATTFFKGKRKVPKEALKKLKKQLDTKTNELQQTCNFAEVILKNSLQWRDYDAPAAKLEDRDTQDPLTSFSEYYQKTTEVYSNLQNESFAKLYVGGRFIGVFMALWILAIYPSLWILNMQWMSWQWIAMSFGVGLVATLAIAGIGYPVAKRKMSQHYLHLLQAVANCDQLSELAIQQAEEKTTSQLEAIVADRDQQFIKADDQHENFKESITTDRDKKLKDANEKYPPLLEGIETQRSNQLTHAKEHYPPRIQQLKDDSQTDSKNLSETQRQQIADQQQQYQQQWQALINGWYAGYQKFCDAHTAMIARCDHFYPTWQQMLQADWRLPEQTPPAVRLGQYQVSLDQLKNGIPQNSRLKVEQTKFEFPVLTPFPDSPSLLVKTSGKGREAAVGLLQMAALRLLTSLPAGKVRFTIIDPIGLGENFSMFMHLADFDELMINSRIWTESAQIEQRLTDLTQHMENVFQKYLRNEFQSIQEYNEYAGEVAEPYRVLVIANFPHNISDGAVKRLTSIVNNGARCGVYTLISVDTKHQLPHGFDLDDLENNATVLRWRNGRFLLADQDLEKLPLSLDTPPQPEAFTQIIRTAGEQSKDARRVEVPFEKVAPSDEQLWSKDSRAEIDVPLGRAGATKLQHMRLGKGTSQHVLIAGKTGSGKSTLLHALITNLALYYSPDEVQFYLIDFKKGVEFKTYATNQLPHARVIAIESEREFGLSVLRRLDEELKERGDTFRAAGVQDLKNYRNALPDEKMPRLLLIIDEFQEFFVEDDKLAQECALLMDRLVRQGRAFGIHVLLGSQTIGGAYSLARSTLGQMAVRVALQCSDSDAHLILSEENTAARLLTRPGEAIYNDANGLLEGNNPFQVVWLDDEDRDKYLKTIRQLAEQNQLTIEPPIVFEGNIPADPQNNQPLLSLLENPHWTERSPSQDVWLGAAVEIKEATAITFRQQSGCNLLIVGQQIESTLGIMSNCLINLALQNAPAANQGDSATARFVMLDGIFPDAAEAGIWKKVSDAVPHDIQIVGPRKAEMVINEIAAEVSRRTDQEDDSAPPIYLFVYNLSRFRDLRKAADDFSFSTFGSEGEKKSDSGKQFSEILREGPVVGVHVIVWCDSYNNLTRWLDRPSIREFEMRILYQMSATDSSNLIDTPAASRLGENRGYLYLEEQGSLEKFRPYAEPTDDWLQQVRQNLEQAVETLTPQ